MCFFLSRNEKLKNEIDSVSLLIANVYVLTWFRHYDLDTGVSKSKYIHNMQKPTYIIEMALSLPKCT